MSRKTFLEIMRRKAHENSNAVIKHGIFGCWLELEQVPFWPGIQNDIENARREAGIESPLWDVWVEAITPHGWLVEFPKREFTEKELESLAIANKRADNLRSRR